MSAVSSAERSNRVLRIGAGTELLIAPGATPFRCFFVILAATTENRLIGFKVEADLLRTRRMSIENSGHLVGTAIGAERCLYLKNSRFSAHIQALGFVIIG